MCIRDRPSCDVQIAATDGAGTYSHKHFVISQFVDLPFHKTHFKGFLNLPHSVSDGIHVKSSFSRRGLFAVLARHCRCIVLLKHWPVQGAVLDDTARTAVIPHDPVSYTHLDVYKRQPKGGAPDERYNTKRTGSN